MSLPNCLPGLVADGAITPELADDARALFAELEQDFRRQFNDQTAAAMASDAALAALAREASRKRFLAGRTIQARKRIEADIATYGGGSGDGAGGGGPIDPRAGPALIGRDPRASYSNVEGRRKAVLGQAQRGMDAIMASHSADLLGRARNKALLDDIRREAFGEDSGNPLAKSMADAWLQTAERLRQRYNAAGGNIGKLDRWGLPQRHDWKKVRAAGFDAWRNFLMRGEDGRPRLALDRMIDERTGRPFTPEGLETVLREVWETIRTDGLNTMTPGTQGRSMMANRRGERRFLVFRDADTWQAYADQFGHGTAYDAMMGHIEGMARDIAAMEILGPNPEATLRWLQDKLAQDAARDGAPGADGVDRAKASGKRMTELWNEYRGANDDPRSEKLALVFSSWRALATAAKLGGAYLSAVTDFAFQASRRRFNGLPQTSMIRDYLKLMRPGSIEDQKLAVRRGLIAEEWASRTSAQNRYLVEELTGEIPRRLAEGVLRLGLLARHTQAMRWVYGMEALATYTEAAGKSFDQLEPKLRAGLERYGIGPDGWDRLRTAPMETDRGVEWLTPDNTGDPELASRFMEMIHEEVDLAVPHADLGTRAMLNSKAERGTVIGEIMRSALLFKSFGISVLLNQTREIMAMSGAQAARYTAGLLIGTTLTGALALQLKALAAGRDPRPMEDEAFWGAAMLQGGGFGIFGDFLHSMENRAGGGFAQTLAGPIVDDVQGVAQIVTSSNPAGTALREIKGMLPGNTLWYARTAMDRLVADQLQELIDPDYRKAWRRMHRRAAEQGTEFWWGPGDTLPDRAPDMMNAIEGEAP